MARVGSPLDGQSGSPLDVHHHVGLCVGVVLYGSPLASRQFSLAPFVSLSVEVVRAKPVPETNHLSDLGAADREDVEIHKTGFASQQTMIEPVGFAEHEHESLTFKDRHVRRLVSRVRHRDGDVDRRLRRQPGYRRTANVLD